MPRSSRHKTQRLRKHGDGELEGDVRSRDRKVKQEEKDSTARVSAKSSKDLVLTSNGGEKKRKDRGEGSVVVVVDDRWNGGADDEQVGEKKPKGEVFEGVDSEKEKGKGKGSESKSRSSRRQDGLSEGGESAKPKIEKESSRRDSSGSQYKSSKEREKDSGKDVKERDREYSKESKERDRDYVRDVKEKDKDYSKDAKEKEKEKERDHSKDVKEKEKERDHSKDVKEKDRDHSKDVKEKERDRDHSKDVKERVRDYNKDVKEKEKDKDYSKDAKEKDKDYNKDAKEKDREYNRDAKEKERDYSRETKEKEREYAKEAKERDRENSRDAKERDKENPRETKERDRDYAKDSKEKDKDYAKDAKEKDRDYAKDREKDHLKDAKDRERDHPKDPKERDRDHLKDPRERGKDYPKDVKEKDAKDRDAKEREPKERDRDHHKEGKDRDRDYYKEDRDRDHYKDVKDRDRENYKDVKEREKDYPKDARERNRDYTRDTKERDKDYKDPRDRDREYYREPRERDRDYKDARERDRGSDRDKRVQDARHERSDDLASRKQTSKISTSGDEIPGGKTQDGLRNPETDKELDKSIRRRDGSGDKARYVGDVRDNDDRRFSSRDDHTKNSSNKDEGQKEGRYRDRYREDLDRDQRDHDERVRDEHSTREHNNNKSGSKHFRDENRFPEGHYKKSKLQETDHGTGPYIDDHGAKPRVTKEPHDDVEKYASSAGKLDPRSDRGRIDYVHADKVDSSLGRPKSSPSAGNHTMKDQSRTSSKQGGPSGRVPSSEEKLRLNTASRGDNVAASGFHERDPEAWSSEKRRPKEGFRSAEAEHVAHYDRTTKSDARPSHLAQKSPSTGGDRRFPDRAGARRSFDIEGHKGNSAKHGRDYLNTNRDRGMPFDKSMPNDHFRGEKFDSEPNPSGLPPFNRTSHLPGSSPGHLPPPPVIGHITGGPSLLGTYEDDNRVQSGDRKPSSRFRRSGEHGMGRGQGNAWKSPSTWQSPVANGFMSLQHGSPHPGFHPSVQQFNSPLYGVTPSMELNHSYMHDAPDRFANHVRPFGWHNPMDDCPPRMPVWDGRNGGFVDDPHMYGRAEWDMNRQIMNNRVWEMTPDMWKGQNGNMNMELPNPQESEYSAGNEAWIGQTGPQSHKDRDPSECLPTINSEVKQSNEKSPVKTGVECPQKNLHEKTMEPSKPTVHETTSNGNGKILFCCNYLSKLDISLDLAQSDLYEECISFLGTKDKANLNSNISLLGTKDKADLSSNISKEEYSQNKKEGLIVAARSRTNILSSVFPSGTDDVFQRAMSLYKKQSGRKAKLSSLLSRPYCAEQKVSSEVDEQTTSVDTPVEDKTIVDNQTSSEGSLAKADSASSFGEGKSTPNDCETSGPIEAMVQQSDCIADAVHFGEGSQTCETIMAECRVNVSRIHLSPGSTH